MTPPIPFISKVGEDIEASGTPASHHGFSQLQPSDYEGHPVVKICQIYWGRNERLANLKPGETIVTANNLMQTDYKLYFFKQYRYMQKRIDHLYALNHEKELRSLERNPMVLFYDNAGFRG